MTQNAQVLQWMIKNLAQEKIKFYNKNEIQQILDELDTDLHFFVNELISVVLHIYFRSLTFGKNDTPSKQLAAVIKQELAEVKQPYNITDILEVEQALGLSDRKLLAIMARQLVNQQEKIIKQEGLLAQKEDEIYNLNLKISCLNTRLGKNDTTSKKVSQAEMKRAGASSPSERKDVSYEKIRELKRLGYTDEKIAEILGVSRATISRRKRRAKEEWEKTFPF